MKVKRTGRKSFFFFRCLWRHRRPLVTEINMAGYVDVRSTSSRDTPSAIAARFVDEYFSLFAVRTLFRYIYFCHERMTLTPEKTRFSVGSNFTLCYVMLTMLIWQNFKPCCRDLGNRASAVNHAHVWWGSETCKRMHESSIERTLDLFRCRQAKLSQQTQLRKFQGCTSTKYRWSSPRCLHLVIFSLYVVIWLKTIYINKFVFVIITFRLSTWKVTPCQVLSVLNDRNRTQSLYRSGFISSRRFFIFRF